MSDQNYGTSAKKLPSSEEIEAMAAFPQGAHSDAECNALCDDLRETADALSVARAADRPRLILRLQLINRHMRALHCRICLPE